MAWNKSTWQDVIGTEISKSTVTFGNSVTGVINTNLASPLKFLNLSIRCEVLFGGSPDGNAEIKVYGRDVLGGDESDTIPIYRQDIEFVTSDSQIITLPNIDTSSIDSLQIEVLNKDTTDSIDVWVSFMYGYIDAVAGSSPDETVKISYNDTTKDYLENKIVGDTGVIEISVLGESLYETLKVSLNSTKLSNWDSAYGWGDHSVEGYLKSFIETDPIFSAWLAYPPALSEFINDVGYLTAETDPDFNSWLSGVTPANWDSAYGWGDHSIQGYLKSFIEVDPVFMAWLSYPPAISEFINDLGYLTAETDPDFNSWLSGVTPANWDSAYGWGDHSIQGYLKSFTETDPIFSAWLSYPPALSEFTNDLGYLIAETDPDFNSWLGTVTPANWDSAYGWGDHSIQGYLKSFIESDPVFIDWLSYPPSLSEFTNDLGYLTAETDPDFNSWLGGVTPANWDSAYGWGDHSIQGYLKSYIETDPVFTDWLNYPPALSEFTNDVGYLTAETDPDFNSWLGGVTPANWDSAYGWGDHSIQGYLKSYVETDPIFSAWLSYPPALSEFTNDMSFITAETDPDFNSWLGGVTPANWDSAYGWGDHSIQGYLKSFTETDPIFSAWLSYPPSLSEFTNDMSFITAETDPDFNSWLGGVTPANWDSAYGWGDHSIQGYIKSFDDYYQERLILAEEFQNPNNADWVVNVLAPLSADDNNNGLNVRLFDDTANEGIGFDIFIPSFATNIVLKFKSRAITAPAGTKKVDLGLYFRSIPDNAAVDAWSAKKNITGIISIPTNEYFQYDTTTISLATLGITSNRYTQFEIIRDAADEANDDLVGDWALLSMIVSFT